MRPIPPTLHMKIVNCKICGKEVKFKIPWNKNLCSSECVYQNKLRIARETNAMRKTQLVTRKCRQCGKEVTSTVYVTRNFCEGKAGKCYREFLSQHRRGKSNPAYRNGFAMQGSRKYTGIHLRACSKYRKAFLKKHSYPFCEICRVNQNGTPKFEVHHIYFASQYPKHPQLHNFLNLIHLCIQCHNDMHAGKKNHEIFKRLEKERGLKKLFAKI